MAPLNPKSQDHDPTADPDPAAAESTLPAYDESAAATAAGERAPFIRPEDLELDVEAQTLHQNQSQPPAYEADANAANAIAGDDTPTDSAAKQESLAAKVCSGALIMLLVAVGLGGILTLFMVFVKVLVWLWGKLGLI
ncbi:hypothetical protein F5Y05DRAFT_413548 [Hypoxylon sp. FL0543]|nr:hypothetical protein F5Y05DRAFT_413548 [Hypoxylon sp. FL0543]